MREHQKQDLLEMDSVTRPIPGWVFNLSKIMPYLTCATFIMASVVIILVHSLKFDSWQERHWYLASVIGLCMVALLLDVIRSAILTIVELRKFEIRKRSKAGDFVVRKVQKQDEKDSLPALLKPKPKVKAKPTAPTPKVAPKFSNMERPKFLPDAIPDAPALMGKGGKEFPMLPPPGGMTPKGKGSMTPMGGMTPKGGRSPKGSMTPTKGGAQTPPRMPFGMNSPGGKGVSSPAHSETSKFSHSLSQSLAARREKGDSTPGRDKPPPPPMKGKGEKGALGSPRMMPAPPMHPRLSAVLEASQTLEKSRTADSKASVETKQASAESRKSPVAETKVSPEGVDGGPAPPGKGQPPRPPQPPGAGYRTPPGGGKGVPTPPKTPPGGKP
jgi:hypothetical protein